MKKLTIVTGAAVLVLGGFFLPSLAQHSGRSVTRETFTESADFVRAGNHVLNRSHIAYVARTGNQSTVYFVGNVPPLVLTDDGEGLIAQLVTGNDPGLPSMPNQGRSPFDNATPRVLPSPGAPTPEPYLKVEDKPENIGQPTPTPPPTYVPREEPKSK